MSMIRKTELLRKKVAEQIETLAQNGFNGAIVDDLTEDSGGARRAEVQVSIDERENVSVVIAAGEDAVWVEFGAGVYHNGSAGSSPHPKGSELGFTIGGYGKGIKKIFFRFWLMELNSCISGYACSTSHSTSRPPIKTTFIFCFDSTTTH